MDKYCIELRTAEHIAHRIKSRKAIWIGHILLRNAFQNRLLKEGEREGKKRLSDEEEGVSSYCISLRKR